MDSVGTETLAAALDQLVALPDFCNKESAFSVGANIWRILTQRTAGDVPPVRNATREASGKSEDLVTMGATRADSTWWGFAQTQLMAAE